MEKKWKTDKLIDDLLNIEDEEKPKLINLRKANE